MTTDLSEQGWGLLQTNLRAGDYAFFVGAGCSRGAGLPGGPELARRMASKLYPSIASDEDALCRFRQDYSFDGPFSLQGVADIIDAQFDRKTLIRYLRNCTVWRADPTSVHYGLDLVSMAVQQTGWPLRIITPNYDTLTSDALQPRVGVVVTETDYHQATDDSPWVFKIHGCIDNDTERSIVITSEDLQQQLPAWKVKAVDYCVRGRGLLIIGYGAGDSHLNDVIVETIVRAGYDREPYWVSPRPPPPEIQEVLEHNGGRHLPITAEAFFKRTGIYK